MALHRVFLAINFFLVVCCSFPSKGFTDTRLTSAQEQSAQEIFGTTLSPFCPGLLLKDCPSGKASELKDEIRGEIAKGKSESTIRRTLNERFGEDTLRAVPKKEGFGLLGWAFPIIFFTAGLVAIYSWLLMLRGETKLEPSLPTEQNNSALEERIKKDLELL